MMHIPGAPCLFLFPILFFAVQPSFAEDALSHPGSPEGPYKGFGYEWENNDLGISDKVPEPWTKLEYGENRIGVWGRDFLLGEGILPRQITSRESEIFIRPPSLKLIIEGVDLFEGTGLQPQITSQEENRAQYEITHAGEGFAVKGIASLEFDGLLKVTIAIIPERPVRIDELTIRMPLHREMARFFNRYLLYDYDLEDFVGGDEDTYGEITGQTVSSSYNPIIWVGNHQIGMELIWETDYNWSNPESDEAIVLKPAGEEVLWEVNVVSSAKEINEPYELTFALLPTPVKDMGDWRRRQIVAFRERESDVLAPNHLQLYRESRPLGLPLKYPGLPIVEPSEFAEWKGDPDEVLRDTIAKIRAEGYYFIPYGALYGMPARLPNDEWKHYREYWTPDSPRPGATNPSWGRDLGLPDYAGHAGGAGQRPRRGEAEPSIIYIDTTPKSFQDFLVWHYVQAIEKYDIDGTYFDISTQREMSRNVHHAHSKFVREGSAHYPFFAQRRLMQRIYTAGKERKPHFFVVQHIGLPFAVLNGFTDQVLAAEINRAFRAEHYSRPQHQKDPTMYVPDYGTLPENMLLIRYGLMPSRGISPIVLPQVIKHGNDDLMRKKHPELFEKYSRSLLVRTSIYDLPVNTRRVHQGLHDEVLTAYKNFGWLEDADYIGPWHPEAAQLLRAGGEALEVGVYLRPQSNSLMLVIVNLGDGAAEDKIGLAAPLFEKANIADASNITMRDAMTLEPIALNAQGEIELELQPDHYRFVIVEQQ